jgi:hypothetical protein
MFDVCVPTAGEVACPSCHIISSVSAWRANGNNCPTRNCHTYVHIVEASAVRPVQKSRSAQPARVR